MLIINKITKIFIVAGMCMALYSCEKDANVKLPPIESKYVVNSYISPQDTEIRVYVSKTRPIFGKPLPNAEVTDANVTITDGAVTMPLVYDMSRGYYVADTNSMKIRAGKTYRLYVNTADGKALKASCTVPGPPDINEIKVDLDTSLKVNSSSYVYNANVSLKWRDIPGGPNYYHSAVDLELAHTSDTTLIERTRLSSSSASELLDDVNRDGKLITLPNLFYNFSETFFPGGFGPTYKFYGIRYFILNTDVNYYKYHITALQGDGVGPGVEPVIVYSNIEGGLGCFGAYNQYTKTIKF